MAGSVNKDAISTGKQEMTAAGRAFISCWLVEEVFDRHFHPDLDPNFSAQLKNIHKNIRKYAPQAQTPEEEEYLTSKTVNWRLTTLEGLQEILRSPQCSQNRTTLTELLKEHLIEVLQVHLQDPPMSDLEGGVHMIIELAVSMALHLPLESRDVQIEYFMPGVLMSNELMKTESGIPSLGTSVAEDAAERMSMRSADSDATSGVGAGSSSGGLESMSNGDSSTSTLNANASSNITGGGGGPADMLNPSGWKRGMLSALTGTKPTKSHAAQGKHAATAGGSTGSLNNTNNNTNNNGNAGDRRPESRGEKDESGPARVRMAVGIGAQVRGKSVLVKASVFSTQSATTLASGRD